MLFRQEKRKKSNHHTPLIWCPRAPDQGSTVNSFCFVCFLVPFTELFRHTTYSSHSCKPDTSSYDATEVAFNVQIKTKYSEKFLQSEKRYKWCSQVLQVLLAVHLSTIYRLSAWYLKSECGLWLAACVKYHCADTAWSVMCHKEHNVRCSSYVLCGTALWPVQWAIRSHNAARDHR
jgi:hypothetical protein